LGRIIEQYRGTEKDLLFEDDFVDRLLRTQKSDPSCFSILALMLPDLDYTQQFHIDHLHPAASFSKDRLSIAKWIRDEEQRSFYTNSENWNGLANLHLLSPSQNTSKQATPLADWFARQKGMRPEDLLIPPDTDLRFEFFEEFINARSQLLKQRLSSLVSS
jgi:hypothetical protein